MNNLNQNGYTPFGLAILLKRLDIACDLLNWDADVNLSGDNVCTPLQQASSGGHLETVALLLEAGADPNFVNNRQKSAVTCAWVARQWEVLELLIEAGGKITPYDGTAPIHHAAMDPSTRALERYIKDGEDVNLKVAATSTIYRKGWTPLHFAALMGNIRNIDALLAAAADPNVIGRDGKTPLHCAVMDPQRNCSREIVTKLMLGGASVLIQHAASFAPVHRLLERNEASGSNDTATMDARDAFCSEMIYIFVAGGDRSILQCLPKPCPRIGPALLRVWMDTPQDLPLLVNMMDNESKEVVQEALRAMHGRLQLEALRIKVLAAVFE